MESITGVTFENLNEAHLQKATKIYNKNNLAVSNITHIDGLAVLPYDCYPNILRPDGEYKDNLHKLYNKYSSNKDEKVKHEIFEEISNRWKGGKQSRWRQDICGKRCNYTARSVLTPNPNLRIDQIGLPDEWKRKLTLRERSNFENKRKKIIYIVDHKGQRFHPMYRKIQKNDDIVRELDNDDLVLVNRQPTLRESNFVSMKVKWHTYKTIQMHPAVFSMFDADCDGDEINIHLPQIHQKYMERMMIQNSFIDYGNYSLTPSVIQDATVGLCKAQRFKNKSQIHDYVLSETTPHTSLYELYKEGTKFSYDIGFSIGFDFEDIDFMISCGAKGKTIHKTKIRSMLEGIYNDDEHFKACQEARVAMISTSLKTAETGYISRRLSYHLNDIIQDKNGKCKDRISNKYLLGIETLPKNVKHIENIGIYLVSVLMPPLTQKMLDSFHAASAGESIDNQTSYFDSLVNCTSPSLKEIFDIKGIHSAKDWLTNEFTKFFDGKIKDFWIKILVEFLFITGEPIGVGMTTLSKRHEILFQTDKISPVFKDCKFGNPLRILKKAVKKNYHDDLSSFHSRDMFFS